MSEAKRAASMVASMQPGNSGVLSGTHADAPENFTEQDLFAAFEADVDAIGGAISPPPKKRSAGRPTGSVNRTTLQLQRFLLQRGYRDPSEMLAALVSQDPVELARSLGGVDAAGKVPFDCALDALKLQRAAAADLMPYFHQRMAQRVELPPDHGGRALIVINDGPLQVNLGAQMKAQENQTLSVHDLPLSDEQMSDGAKSDA